MSVIRDRNLGRVALVNFAYLWMIVAVYDTMMPLFARDHLNMTPTMIGGVFAVALVTEMLVMYPAGAAADRLGRKPVGIATFAWLVVIVSLVGLTTSRVLFFLVMAAVGTATGSSAVVPTAMLGDVAAKESSGTAVGVFRFAGDLGMTLGPLVAGLTTNALGFKAAFMTAVAPSVIALVMLARMPETLKRSG
jgi:MFS family permease